jgi:hypothetical protein
VDVRVDPSAAEFALARGGEIFLWVSDIGLLHVSTKPPKDPIDWVRVPVGEVTVLVDPSASCVEYWRIELDRFPPRRLRGVSNMTPGSVQEINVGGLA